MIAIIGKRADELYLIGIVDAALDDPKVNAKIEEFGSVEETDLFSSGWTIQEIVVELDTPVWQELR